MIRRHPSLLSALLLWIPAALAEAQTAAPPPPPPPPPPAVAVTSTKGALVSNEPISRLADKPQGWSYNLKLGANLSLTSNKDVVGQLDGNTILVGINILSGIGYLHGKHEWLNTIALSEAWSNTPDLPFVKAGDLLDVQTIYNYFINEFTGPFVRAQLQTSILGTDRVTTDAKTYVDTDTGDVLETGRRFHLSDAFQPLTVSESGGWFVQPVHSERLNVFSRAGFGGRQTFAEGAYALDDDKDTEDQTEVKLLRDVHQAGVELFAGLDGKEIDGKILYALGATALFPMINNDNENRSIAKLTRVQLQAAVGFGIFSWMSLNYMLRVVRDVQLVDAIQVTNTLLLSFQYGLQKPPTKVAPSAFPAEAQAKIAELEARVKAAEDRAGAAEARVPLEPPPPAPLPSEPTPVPPNTTPAPTGP
jgi:hypothetical protein